MRSLLRILFNLILGGMLIFGGIRKFDGPAPAPTQMIDTVKKGEEIAPNGEVLKIRNFIFGMKQTGYFWEFLGVMELLAGVLLVSQVFSLFGAILALPLVINIFLFHYYLEPEETGELAEMAGLLFLNIVLLAFGYRKWKAVLYMPEAFRLR
jgi:uncharacterized membrane protein YphA (DoxX/SURF4 family)